ncbi:hypothetical protein CTAYLR_009598 [Chrysophaeum taylorii]|uniref:Uncharacterized protein n=1 Tax=Chrysophaeum taylorii TaxID=2483200 RepID=A0AAD7UIN3_9STRA|nr:hypothetical protein CTAYLR_009598 [Chrysophaeum taylorii]
MSELRRGKWTVEEERYVERVIHDFNNGTLQAAPGTTLRNFLSEKLNCDPMRITKKFTGEASIGKRVFHPCDDEEAVEQSKREIAALEAAWRSKLERQQRESTAAPRTKVSAGDDARDRRIDAHAAQQLDAWLERARHVMNSSCSNEDVDDVVREGEELRTSFVASQPASKFAVQDEEATTLLVDFLRSAQKGVQQHHQAAQDLALFRAEPRTPDNAASS